MTKKLKIFDAVEEVMRMDGLQLIQARKHFDWAYLRKSLEELREYVDEHKFVDIVLDAAEKTNETKTRI